MALTFSGTVARFIDDSTREISLEGGFRSGKTTAAIWKVRKSLKDNPGIQWFICRYADVDIQTKLKPAIDSICYEFDPNDLPQWNASEKAFEFANGSRLIMYGLQTVAALSRYAKLRGLGGAKGVAGIMVDEAQEMPADIALELRGRPSQKGFPIQIIFVSNPLNHDDWLAEQFPESNKIPHRRYYSVSIYDNAHNLADDMIAGLEAAYPPEHAKHKTVILGQRGVNVEGDPVYSKLLRRKTHVRDLTLLGNSKLFEAFDVWKHNFAWVVAERPYFGGLWFHGGVLGQRVSLQHFLDIVKQQRADWFSTRPIATCCVASSKTTELKRERYTAVTLLREAGFMPQFRDNGNEPDIVLAMIERIASYMRQRGATGDELFGIHESDQRWLRVSKEGIVPCQFLTEAFESGYVWDDHFVSVNSLEVKQPKADDWFEHGMRCAETLELNFGASRPTDDEAAKRKAANARRARAFRESALTRADGWLAS